MCAFRSKATVQKSKSIARVTAPPTPQIFSPTGASLVLEGGQVIAGGVLASPTGAQLVAQGGTVVYGGINARPTGASLVSQSAAVFWRNYPLPSEMSGVVAWYDASQLVGLNDGDPIATWSDLSGNGNDLTAAGTARPTYKTNIQNGHPIARFNGTSNVMVTAAFGSPIAQPFSICLVLTYTGPDRGSIVEALTLTPRVQLGHGNLGSNDKFGLGAGSGFLEETGTHPEPVAWGSLGAFFSGSSSRIQFNGTTISPISSAGTNSLDGLTVGKVPTLATFATMDVGELILIGSSTIADLDNLALYYRAKWATP